MWQHTICRFLFATAHSPVPFSHNHLQYMGKDRYLNGIHNYQLTQHLSTQTQPTRTCWTHTGSTVVCGRGKNNCHVGVFVRDPLPPCWAFAFCKKCFQTTFATEHCELLNSQFSRAASCFCYSEKLSSGSLSFFLYISLPTSVPIGWEGI